jgi:RNA polymerase sigma-70 factor, ECF subfamily
MASSRQDSQFESLYKRYGPEVRRAAYRYCQNQHDAEDIAQEVMLRLWRACQAGDAPANVPAWLMRVVRQRWLDLCRSAFVRKRCSGSQGWGALDIMQSRELAPDEALEAQERQREQRQERRRVIRKVRNALATLPAHDRDVLLMSDLQDMSCREIAAVTGRGKSTIHRNLPRQRARLRAALGTS